MDNKKIKQLKTSDIVQSFFLVKAADCKTGSNNKSYLDLTLVDQTGEINAKIWDPGAEDAEQYVPNTLVKVRGVVNEWQSGCN